MIDVDNPEVLEELERQASEAPDLTGSEKAEKKEQDDLDRDLSIFNENPFF